MYKVVICDDNREYVEKCAKAITLCAKKNQIDIEISCYYSGEELLFNYCEKSFYADVIYLDILMNKVNGMETARKLRDIGCSAQIVFLSRITDFVYDAFEVDAVQYLVKGEIVEDKFEKVFLKSIKLAEQRNEELFVCEFDGVKNIISIDTISYFDIWKRVVTVHHNDDQSKFYSSIEQLEKFFKGKDFIRVHRSYLVHLPYIYQFQAQKLHLKTGEIIPVGVTYLQSSKEAFSDYVSRFHIYDLNL